MVYYIFCINNVFWAAVTSNNRELVFISFFHLIHITRNQESQKHQWSIKSGKESIVMSGFTADGARTIFLMYIIEAIA